jgi:hypothetical protein
LQLRALQLQQIAAATLVHIDTTLTDLAVLAQQQTDLLRRLVERNAEV